MTPLKYPVPVPHPVGISTGKDAQYAANPRSYMKQTSQPEQINYKYSNPILVFVGTNYA